MQDPRAELVAQPEVAIGTTLDRLGIEVGAREQAIGGGVLVDDVEAGLVVRVTEGDVVADRDAAGSTLAVLKSGVM